MTLSWAVFSRDSVGAAEDARMLRFDGDGVRSKIVSFSGLPRVRDAESKEVEGGHSCSVARCVNVRVMMRCDFMPPGPVTIAEMYSWNG